MWFLAFDYRHLYHILLFFVLLKSWLKMNMILLWSFTVSFWNRDIEYNLRTWGSRGSERNSSGIVVWQISVEKTWVGAGGREYFPLSSTYLKQHGSLIFFSLGSSTYNLKIISKFYWYVLAIFHFFFFLHHFFHFNNYFLLYPQTLVPDHPHSMQNHEALIIGYLLL